MKSPTYYDVLGVAADASDAEITKAYRRAMRIAHPDASGTNDSPLAVLVSQAYEVLKNPEKRAQYDQTLRGEDQTSTPEWGVEEEWTEAPPTPQYASDGYPPEQDEPYFAHATPVDLSKLSWLPKVDSLAPATYTPRKRSVINPLLLSALGLFAYIGVPQIAVEDLNTRMVFGAFQILGLLLLLPFAFGQKGRGGWIGFTFSGLVLAAFFALQAGSVNMGAYFAFTAIVMSWAALSWRKWRVSRGAGTEDIVPLQLVQNNRVFGDPGVGLYDAMNFFGAENVAKGVHGERLTAETLEHLLALPGVRIIHGLRFPGSKKADVDHAIICGNRVAFVDSKYWPGGHWKWEAPGYVANYRTPGKPARPRQTHFQNAVESFKSSLKDMEVQGWILIHPSDAHIVHTDNSKAAGQPRLVNSQEALEEIGSWLLAGKPCEVNRRHMAELLKIKN